MNKVDKLYRIIEENRMSGEEVADLFIYYTGQQILTPDFFSHAEDEGYYIPKEER